MLLNEEDIQWAKSTIQKTELFNTCTQDELNRLLEGLEKQHYHAGSTILFQGEISSRLYLVEAGLVAIWARKGKDKTKVAELGPNSYFGEISLLTPRAATATVKAEAETEIVFLPGEVVEAIMKNNPSLGDAMKQKIDERLVSRQQAMDNKEKK